MTSKTKYIFTARKYVGQKELPQNQGFENPEFQQKMRSVGWWKNAEWCSLFGRLVWSEALPDPYKAKALQLISPSSQMTFQNFAKDTSGLFKIEEHPMPGALVIWQSKTKPGKGHVGIVERVTGRCIYTIEGNLNNQVKRVKRCYPYSIGDSLVLRGFVVPIFSKKILKTQNETVRGLPEATTLQGDLFDDFSDFVDKALRYKNFNGNFKFYVNSKLAREIKKIHNLNTLNWKIIIYADKIRHIINEHGDYAKELERGQYAVYPDDIKQIPYILSDFSEVGRAKGIDEGKERNAVKIMKIIQDGKYIVTFSFVVNEDNKYLKLETFFIHILYK